MIASYVTAERAARGRAKRVLSESSRVTTKARPRRSTWQHTRGIYGDGREKVKGLGFRV